MEKNFAAGSAEVPAAVTKLLGLDYRRTLSRIADAAGSTSPLAIGKLASPVLSIRATGSGAKDVFLLSATEHLKVILSLLRLLWYSCGHATHPV